MVGVVLERPIVIGESYGARNSAFVDARTTVQNRARLCTSHSRGIGAGRGLILRASRTIFVLAARRVAVVAGIAAPYRESANATCRFTGRAHTSRFTAAVASRTRSKRATTLSIGTALTRLQAAPLLVDMSMFNHVDSTGPQSVHETSSFQISHIQPNKVG